MITIKRDVAPGRYNIKTVFTDLASKPVLVEIFDTPQTVAEVMAQTDVNIVAKPYEMSVDNDDGTINIGIGHLQKSSKVILYLDIIHELFHVRQHRQGRNLYDRSKSYVNRETEIEAFQFTVKEARRIGMSDKEIFDYLQVPWITAAEHRILARKLDVTFEETK